MSQDTVEPIRQMKEELSSELDEKFEKFHQSFNQQRQEILAEEAKKEKEFNSFHNSSQRPGFLVTNQEMTVNSDQDLEKLQECDNEFIKQELHRLSEIESQRPLEPKEEEREVMLLAEEINRRYNTKEFNDEAVRL